VFVFLNEFLVNKTISALCKVFMNGTMRLHFQGNYWIKE